MKRAEEAEASAPLRPPVFTIGQDRRGNWVVQDQRGIAGGLFVTRDAALRYVRFETAYQPCAVVAAVGNLELNVTRNPAPPPTARGERS